MASFANVDKNDANALTLLAALKEIMSDAKKQERNKSPDNKDKNKRGNQNGNPETTNTNGPTWQQVEKILTNFTYHIVATIKDAKKYTKVRIVEVKDENASLKKKVSDQKF